MEVKISVVLDIPGAESYSEGELAQLIFDEYINYVTCSHLRDALKLTCAAVKSEDPSYKLLADHHNTWADIARNATWTLERNEDHD